MSRSFVASHFPTSPVVPIGFLVLCFPFIPPALTLFSFLSLSCPSQFPFVSLSCPVAFLSCRLPSSSPHFLALPWISPLLPNISRKKHSFSSVFAIRTSNNTEFFQIFGKRRQEPQTRKEPAGGIEPGSLRCPTRQAMKLGESWGGNWGVKSYCYRQGLTHLHSLYKSRKEGQGSRKTPCFSMVFQQRESTTHRVFRCFQQEEAQNLSRQREAAGGFKPGTPISPDPFPEDYFFQTVIVLPRGTWGRGGNETLRN